MITEFKWPGHRALILARRKTSKELGNSLELAKKVMRGEYDDSAIIQYYADEYMEKYNDSTK